jgi:hypothetical protein
MDNIISHWKSQYKKDNNKLTKINIWYRYNSYSPEGSFLSKQQIKKDGEEMLLMGFSVKEI